MDRSPDPLWSWLEVGAKSLTAYVMSWSGYQGKFTKSWHTGGGVWTDGLNMVGGAGVEVRWRYSLVDIE